VSIGSVTGIGARTPAGLTALQLAMATRAGAITPAPTPFVDRRGRPVGLAMVGGLPTTLQGYERMVELCAPALREAAVALEHRGAPLVVAVPEAGRPDDDPRLDGSLPSALARRCELPIDLDRSVTVRAGHAGVALAARHAAELLARGTPEVIVGGVDSFVHEDVLRWLDEGYRLHATGVENGLVPSEGAAFFVLRHDGPRGAQGPEPLGRLTHATAGVEPSVGAGEPNLASAATTLGRAIVEATGRCPWVVCDVNGERHRVREWQMLALRELWADDVVELRLPERLGDVGAASGAVAAVVAAALWRAGAAPAASCTVVLSSEGAERGVLRLEQAT
jgi:3-oxoacyl-[acyl-carrier-protein] synthase-1